MSRRGGLGSGLRWDLNVEGLALLEAGGMGRGGCDVRETRLLVVCVVG